MNPVLATLVIGLGATVVFDLWGVLVSKALGLPVANWKLGGRWFAHLGRGRLRHDSIAAAPEVQGEQALGWVAHYGVGLAFAAATVALGGRDWLAAPTLPLPLAVGVLTVGFGWFVMSPAMGNGVAASRASNPWLVRRLNLAAHVVFGLAMWGIARTIA